MEYSAKLISTLLPIIIIILYTNFMPSKIQASPPYDYHCTYKSGSYEESSAYKENLKVVISSIKSSTQLTGGFYNVSVGSGEDKLDAIGICRGDSDESVCLTCLQDAVDNLPQKCPTQKEAICWYDICMLRYSPRNIFHKMEISPNTCLPNPNNVGDPNSVNRTRTGLLEKLKHEAVANRGSALSVPYLSMGEMYLKGIDLIVHAMLQCTPDINASACSNCLDAAIHELTSTTCSYYKIGGRLLMPSCFVRYEVASFFNVTPPPPWGHSPSPNPTNKPGKKGSSSHIAVAVTVPLLVVALLLVCSFYFFKCYRKRQKSSEALVTSNFESIATAESLQFDFRTIREATNNFSVDNKLGEGGFGVVYKGSLSDGQEIAVKKLSETSRQGIIEFKTEVDLVAKLQHKNLVRLLGYCLWKDEKLLVYEFLPNSSLDKVLLDPSKSISLDWETRYKIIAGIARGLLYLHEDSRLKVIHRDLKSSNILLDERMNPKISDFGLARLVGTNQIQADTNRIVGTYGYMAPEYAMTGRFSAKSDVYSFGVIVLEIISGHKCNSMVFPYEQESVTERAWSLWNENKSLELVDSRLEGKFSKHEVAICIHIGLLCLQEDTNMRPAMDSIVAALNGHPVDLPPPAGPHLIQSTNPSSTTQSSSTFSGSNNITELHTR